MADIQFLTLRDATSSDISERNFIAIFAILIRQLHLKDSRAENKPQEKSYLKKIEMFAKRPPPFSFEVSRAIGLMSDLKLDLKLKVSHQVQGKIVYSVEPQTAYELLKKYFLCHLIHNPASRTAACLTSQNTTVQITPKGTALVQKFYRDVGLSLDQMPEVIKSNFNTMRLLEFRRSKATGRALYSECFNHVLTSEMFGPAPHVWSPSAKHEASTEMQTKKLQAHEPGHAPALGINQHYLLTSSHSFVVESPFYHRYFLNPESDCHVQYFESGSGVRVFRNRTGLDSKTCIPYCFSGKAFVQWLMDCSTLYSVKEAMAIGQILLRHGLIMLVSTRDAWDRFVPERDALYTLTSKATCQWKFCADHHVKLPNRSWDGGLENSVMCKVEDVGRRNFDTDSDRTRSGSDTSVGSEKWGSAAESQSERQPEQVQSQRPDTWEKASDASCRGGSEKSAEHSLKALLLDPGLSHLFRKHLEKELCAENLDAYLQIDEFLQQKHQGKDLSDIFHNHPDACKREAVLKAARSLVRRRLLMALQLYGKYFSPDGPCTLNIGFDLQQQLDQVFEVGSPAAALDDLRNYMQTPVLEKHMFSELEDPGAGEPAELPRILEPLDKAHRVFRRIASSIYRLMETDSYVNFIRSLEYAQAIQTFGK